MVDSRDEILDARPSLARLMFEAISSPTVWGAIGLGVFIAIVGTTGVRSGGGADGWGQFLIGGAFILAGLLDAGRRFFRKTRDRPVGRRRILDDAGLIAHRAGDRESDARLLRLDRALTRIESLDKSSDLTAKADDLWNRCLAECARMTTLHRAAVQMSTSASRQRVHDQRETLRDELDTALGRLEAALDHVQLASLQSDEPQEMIQASNELDRGLEIARAVDRRMVEFEQSTRTPEL